MCTKNSFRPNEDGLQFYIQTAASDSTSVRVVIIETIRPIVDYSVCFTRSKLMIFRPVTADKGGGRYMSPGASKGGAERGAIIFATRNIQKFCELC